jgi:DNA modification methylase
MSWMIIRGDARHIPLKDNSVQCCVTSPPYWGLRDYGVAGQLGLERTPEEYVENMVAVFREVKRVLRPDGVLFLNLGDSYASGSSGDKNIGDPNNPAIGHGGKSNYKARARGRVVGLKPKDLVGIPWRVAFALQADGWYLRSDIIWSKPNPMPESVTDRPTKAHEYIFLLSKSERYFWDQDAVKEANTWPDHNRFGNKNAEARRVKYLTGNMRPDAPEHTDRCGHNLRSVWTIATEPYAEAHFATFPTALAERCIKAGTSEKGCCSECGSAWVREVERERSFESGSGRSGNLPNGKNGLYLQGGGETLDIRRGPVVHTVTSGWSPSCTCNASLAKCIVLDPFAGAGTVPLVADRLGRHGIGQELKAEYCMLGHTRVFNDAPLFAAL